jgi:hypothetical protein
MNALNYRLNGKIGTAAQPRHHDLRCSTNGLSGNPGLELLVTCNSFVSNWKRQSQMDFLLDLVLSPLPAIFFMLTGVPDEI